MGSDIFRVKDTETKLTAVVTINVVQPLTIKPPPFADVRNGESITFKTQGGTGSALSIRWSIDSPLRCHDR